MFRIYSMLFLISAFFVIPKANALLEENHASGHSQGNDAPTVMQIAGTESFFGKLKNAVGSIGRSKNKEDKKPNGTISFYGLTRDENREIQELLITLGYSPGTADGLPGARTRSAIKEFQAAEGLPIDGKPSLELLDQLILRTQPSLESPSTVESLQRTATTAMPDSVSSTQPAQSSDEPEIPVFRQESRLGPVLPSPVTSP